MTEKREDPKQENSKSASDARETAKKDSEVKASEEEARKRSEDEDEDDDRDDEDDEDDDRDEDEDRDEDDDEAFDEDDEERPASRRWTSWLLLGGIAAVILVVVWKIQAPADVPTDTELAADLTLITADKADLDCATAEGVGSYQCGFTDEKKERKVEEGKKLRPFMTLNRDLYLIPGLFLEPAIDKRYKSEPPGSKPRSRLKRFTAKCKLKIVGQLDGVELRWTKTGKWQPPASDVRVATVSGCTIEG